MSRRRVVIHLGLPKCGSSALQLRLRANTEQALARGVLYPLHRRDGKGTGAGFAPGHMVLAKDLSKADRRDDGQSTILAKFLAEFDRSGAHTLVLSSESFSKRFSLIQPAAVAPLQELDVDLVLFTRRADAQAISAYKHLVKKQRYEGSFRAFVEASEQGESMRAAMSIGQTLRDARRLFPAATLHFFDLDASGGDSIALFGQVAGLPLEDWSSDPKPNLRAGNAMLLASGRVVNQSHSDTKTLFLLACNRSTLSDAVIKSVNEALTRSPDSPSQARRIISEADSRRLLDAFLRHNAAVQTEFGIALPDHAPMAGALPGEPRTELTGEEMRMIIDQVAPLVSEVIATRLRDALLPPELVGDDERS